VLPELAPGGVIESISDFSSDRGLSLMGVAVSTALTE
jgi:hypothetical protein